MSKCRRRPQLTREGIDPMEAKELKVAAETPVDVPTFRRRICRGAQGQMEKGLAGAMGKVRASPYDGLPHRATRWKPSTISGPIWAIPAHRHRMGKRPISRVTFRSPVKLPRSSRRYLSRRMAPSISVRSDGVRSVLWRRLLVGRMREISDHCSEGASGNVIPIGTKAV
jgi:hypothetical protein